MYYNDDILRSINFISSALDNIFFSLIALSVVSVPDTRYRVHWIHKKKNDPIQYLITSESLQREGVNAVYASE